MWADHWQEIVGIFSIVSVVTGIVALIISKIRQAKKEGREEGEEDGSTKSILCVHKNRLNNHSERIGRLEQRNVLTVPEHDLESEKCQAQRREELADVTTRLEKFEVLVHETREMVIEVRSFIKHHKLKGA
jgi:hypothetical protein